MATKVKIRGGICSLTLDGKEFRPDKNGVWTLDPEHLDQIRDAYEFDVVEEFKPGKATPHAQAAAGGQGEEESRDQGGDGGSGGDAGADYDPGAKRLTAEEAKDKRFSTLMTQGFDELGVAAAGVGLKNTVGMTKDQVVRFLVGAQAAAGGQG